MGMKGPKVTLDKRAKASIKSSAAKRVMDETEGPVHERTMRAAMNHAKEQARQAPNHPYILPPGVGIRRDKPYQGRPKNKGK